MYFFIKDDELMKKYNKKYEKVSHSIKQESDSEALKDTWKLK